MGDYRLRQARCALPAQDRVLKSIFVPSRPYFGRLGTIKGLLTETRYKNFEQEELKIIKQQQPPVMGTITLKQRQAISSTVQATLQMLVEADLKICGEISRETFEAIQTQGFVLQNGTVQLEQEASALSAKGKPSLRTQLRTTAKEMEQCPHSAGRTKSGEAR